MKHVLLVTIGYSPNVGGIETHFDDLTAALHSRNWKVSVLTYKPITTDIAAKVFETTPSASIIRIPWFRGIFYKLVQSPFLEFLFLAPGLFFGLPLYLFFKGASISVIHSHGLIAGFASVFWGFVFDKRVITTTHSVYSFPKTGVYRKFAQLIFSSSDHILTLSQQSKKEIVSLGIPPKNVTVFTYWINLQKFKRILHAKEKLSFQGFVVLFVGRLVEEKGIKILLNAAKQWNKNISLVVAGSGPLEQEVENSINESEHIHFVGRIKQQDLPLYYSAANALVVPSIHEEGFGRVILESLACGTPVIGSNRGAIPEAIGEGNGWLIDISKENLVQTVEKLYKNPTQTHKNTRSFAVKNYGEKNVETIIKTYAE